MAPVIKKKKEVKDLRRPDLYPLLRAVHEDLKKNGEYTLADLEAEVEASK